VEVLLAGHPAVREVAVVAAPDERTGERVCACVVPADPAAPPTLPDLTGYLTARGMSRRKHPEQLVVLEALPVTAAGKVDKQVLRERVAAAGPGGAGP
jgi:non-ribosomal peptide synthetase component E (peptide arylation enzyme)